MSGVALIVDDSAVNRMLLVRHLASLGIDSREAPDGQAALDAETKGYAGRADVGAFLRERVFAPAATLRWDALCRHATGAPLSPDAFAREYV